MHAHSVLLLDEYGQPLSARLHGVLLPLAARLQRQFPALNDDCARTEVLEESGRRIAAREERKGPLDNPQAYAWVVVRRMAALRLRHDQWAVASATLTGAASELTLRRMPAGFATSEQIYNDLLYKELTAHLSPIEQQSLGRRGPVSPTTRLRAAAGRRVAPSSTRGAVSNGRC